jgi:peptidoglycan/xylan/chitin deacetylase (PgdA/CDA1 family)
VGVVSDPASDQLSAIEQRLRRSLEDESSVGKPLSRRARQTKRSVEAYLRAGGVPRYMERLRDIDAELSLQSYRLQRAHRALQRACHGDPLEFERRWRARAGAWRLDRVNQLIREHNQWYPVETGLPMDPRTGDYVRRRGRSYRRAEVGPEWILERFPPTLEPALR